MYISIDEINSYLWTSWEDTLMELLNNIVTEKINSYLWIDGLFEDEYEESYEFFSNWPYYLKQLNPTLLSKVDWVVFAWDYQLQWRDLKFYLPLFCTDSVWNKIEFTYTAWYTDIPSDIKWVCLDLVSLLYNYRKTNGITSFTQWQITVNYWNNTDQTKQEWIVLERLKKYKKNNIYSY